MTSPTTSMRARRSAEMEGMGGDWPAPPAWRFDVLSFLFLLIVFSLCLAQTFEFAVDRRQHRHRVSRLRYGPADHQVIGARRDGCGRRHHALLIVVRAACQPD